ncbi:acyltransferase family protein [Myceligenerans halotolerans]
MFSDTKTRPRHVAIVAPIRSEQRARIEEIHGLRGVALVLVAAFHLFGNGRVSGGVDVFLVVSGFLATRSLLGRVTRGELSLITYYGRTFLRLALPALVVLGAVWVLMFLVAPEASWHQTGREIVAAALYGLNWEMISGQLAYGAAGPDTSSLQHFWSLSVQGQFFVVWPLVILALAYVVPRARTRMSSLPGLVAVVVGLGTAASFLFAVWLSGQNQAEAYFHTGARFWELGVGALAALMLPKIRMSDPVAGLLGVAGLVLVVSCGFVIDGGPAFPGPLALWPVAGALLVVLGSVSERPTMVRRVLRLRPVTFVADISYGLYLWHWVLLVAFLQWRRHDTVAVPHAAVILVAAVLLAWITHKVVDPLPAAAMRRSPGTPLIAVATCVGLFAATSVVGLNLLDRARAEESARIEAVMAGAGQRCLGAAALDPEKQPCVDPGLEGLLVPATSSLDTDQHSVKGCWSNRERPVELRVCTVGPTEGFTRHLFAVGDSHNHALVGAYQQIADEHDWRIDIAGRTGCHWNARPRVSDEPELTRLCSEWNRLVDAHVGSRPELDAIIVTHSARAAVESEPGEDRVEALATGLEQAWAKRPSETTRILAIKDLPIFEANANVYLRDVVHCVEEAGPEKAGAACSRPRSAVVIDEGLRQAAGRDPNAVFIDRTDLYCGPEMCSPVVGHTIVYRDGYHLTGMYARTIARYLGESLAEALDQEPGT